MPASIIKSLFPQTIETRRSKINDKVTVQLFLGKPSIIVDDLTQSGGLVEHIWQKGIKYASHHVYVHHDPKKILVLGLGAGSLIKYLVRSWPQANITALEIDPVMIELGEKYFHLSQYKQLTVIGQDAFPWLEKDASTFDLILIDLYQGRQLPMLASSTEFFTTIKKKLNINGVALFNRLVLADQKIQVQEFKKGLDKVFTKVIRVRTQVNWLLLAQP